MTQQLMDRFLANLRAEFPEYPLSVRPYQSPDDDTVEFFIDILLVPQAQLHAVGMRAWELADEVYGDIHVPFLMTSVSPESSVEYFAEALPENDQVFAGAGTFVETLLPFPLDMEGITITYSVETPLFSGLDEAIRWIEPGPELFELWPTVKCEMFLAAGPALLLAPSMTKLPTSVLPDDSHASYSLAA